MSQHLLRYSMFQEVLFPSEQQMGSEEAQSLSLKRAVYFAPHPNLRLSDVPFVVFDLETTGLDAQVDRIIEIGAQKIFGSQLLGEYSSLVDPGCEVPEQAQKISGITPDMLMGQPSIAQVLPQFLQFIEGSILVAHNAAFDMSFIRQNAQELGIDFQWPVFCTLKMARELLPDLERKNLDTLAAHYGLSFEARHRSIGDVKVTVAVLRELLQNEGADLSHWRDMQAFYV